MKKLDDYAINELTPLFVTEQLTGSKLVTLFNEYGDFRDVYDSNKGGLPKLYKEQTLNTSKKNYINDRLKKMRDKDGDIKSLLETKIVNDEIMTAIDGIISKCGYSVAKVDGKYVVSGGIVRKTNVIKTDAKFQSICNNILIELDKARVSIDIAAAWFTKKELFDKLIEKKSQNVNIRIIVNKDHINENNSNVDLSQFDAIKIRNPRGGIMHNKFCVIDNQTVITGSFNWTNNAEYRNYENIQITKGDNELATNYSVEFNKLWNSANEE